MNYNTQQTCESIVIENFQCSFKKCRARLIPPNDKFMFYYLKPNPPLYDIDGQIINSITENPTEIRFICSKCIGEMEKDGRQYQIQICEKIEFNHKQYSVYFNKEGIENQTNPKQGKFTMEKQYCQLCLTNQKLIKEFDRNIQIQYCNPQDAIEIAKFYAQEQFNKDQETFRQLQKRLNQNRTVSMEKLMILNKMRIIMKKYQ